MNETPTQPAGARIPGEKRTPNQRESDLLRLADLLGREYSQDAIARELHLSKATVSRACAELRQRWREQTNLAMSDLTAREAARLDEVARAAWADYYSPGATLRQRTALLDTVTRTIAVRSRVLGLEQQADVEAARQQVLALLEHGRRAVLEAVTLYVKDGATLARIAEHLQNPPGTLAAGANVIDAAPAALPEPETGSEHGE